MRDHAEFEQLARTHQDAIYRFAYSALKSAADADDVTQNVLIALYRSDKEFESEAHVRNWLFKVAANECRSFWRAPWTKHDDVEAYAETLAADDPDHADLFAAIMRLDKPKRIVIDLFYIEGYSIAEIAEILRIPAATVGTRLGRARAKLREYLKEDD